MKKLELFYPFLAILSLLTSFTSIADSQSEGSASPFSPPEEEMMVDVEGGRVYVRVNGINNDATPVIFIHGGPGGTHNVFASLLGMANDRKVIMYDQLDSGKSDQPNEPKNWRVERFVSELESIRKALSIERWHLVGFSWGAALALEYNALYPEKTASLVLGGTYISTPRWIMDASILVENAPKEIQKTLQLCESEQPPNDDICFDAYSVLYSKHYRPSRANRQQIVYDEKIGGNGFNELIYENMWGPSEFSSTGVLKHYNAIPLLKKVNPIKTLFLIGQYDSARIDTIQEYLLLTPGAEFAVIPGASHSLINDRPKITEAVLTSWLLRNDDL